MEESHCCGMSLLRCATLWLAVAALSTAVDVDDLKKSDEVTTVPLYTYRDEAYAADVLVGKLIYEVPELCPSRIDLGPACIYAMVELRD